jgi:FKBP-type peptidyl-prolyl cis-trans isomerase 2
VPILLAGFAAMQACSPESADVAVIEKAAVDEATAVVEKPAGVETEVDGAAVVEDAAAAEKTVVVEQGRRVLIEYTLTLDDGSIAESRTGDDAVTYEHGSGPLWKGLQNALAGLAPGESKTVTLSPTQGFGALSPDKLTVVPAEILPEETRKVGAGLYYTTDTGEKIPVRVREIRGGEIVLDANHPLAGETLHFDVRIVSVE